MKRILMLGVLFLAIILTGCKTEEVVKVDATLNGIEKVTIRVGETFNPMTGVTATDHDGSDITSKVTVEGTVDTNTAGSYQLTYKVTGASKVEVVKTRNVVVLSNAPVITVDPLEVTITVGDELDVLFGVSADDDIDTNVTVTVKDNGGFNKDVIGTYTVTYEAKDSEDNVGTATRTIIVEEVKINYVVEVQVSYDSKWTLGTKIVVNGKNVLRVSADTDLGDPEQVTLVINESDSPITLTSNDSHGEAAIININGLVKEGRDGANGKLVNAENPLRTSGAQLTAATYATDMVVPARGFLLIAPNTAGGAFDTDGRSFVAKSIIHQYDNVVSIYAEDNSEILTQYINIAPIIKNLTKLEVIAGATTFDVKSGLSVVDDNGTFDPADDITIALDQLAVQDDPNFNINTPGTYTFMLAVQDAEGNIRSAQRQVVVHPLTPTDPTLEINGQRHVVDPTLVNPATINTSNVNFYTPDYTSNLSELVVKWGVVVVVDAAGKTVLVRDPYGTQFDSTNPTGAPADGWAADNMMAGLANITEGYVMIFPNGSTSRAFALSNARVIGADVKTYNIYLKQTILANNKTYTFDLTNVNPTTINTSSVNIFTTSYTGDFSEFAKIGYGVVVVIDAEGKIQIVRDAANGKQYDVNYPLPSATSYQTAASCGWSSTDMLVGLTIPVDGVVLVFPHNGQSGDLNPRTFGLNNLRAFDRQVTFYNFTY